MGFLMFPKCYQNFALKMTYGEGQKFQNFFTPLFAEITLLLRGRRPSPTFFTISPTFRAFFMTKSKKIDKNEPVTS